MSIPAPPVILGYDTVRDYLVDCFTDRELAVPQIDPGPPTYEGVADSTGPAVILTIGGGPGLELEDQYDRVMLAIDVAGDQGDSNNAEMLANLVDWFLLQIYTPRVIGGIRFLAVRRAGGRPTPTGVDDGDRWHLACSYVARVRSGY